MKYNITWYSKKTELMDYDRIQDHCVREFHFWSTKCNIYSYSDICFVQATTASVTMSWRQTEQISCGVFVWWLICDLRFQVDWTLWNITRSAVMSGRWRRRCPGGVWLWSALPWPPWSTCWRGFRVLGDWVTSWNITRRQTNGSCPAKYVPSPSPVAWSVWWTRVGPTRRTWIPHLYPPPLWMGDCSVATATMMRCLRWEIDLLLCQKSSAVLYICWIVILAETDAFSCVWLLPGGLMLKWSSRSLCYSFTLMLLLSF